MIPTIPLSPEQKRDLTRAYKDNSLLRALAEHRITLPANAIEWRVPPKPTTGYILGITQGSINLLCTDGIVGWFSWSDGTLLHGHMQHFIPDKEEKEKLSEADKIEKKKKILTKLTEND